MKPFFRVLLVLVSLGVGMILLGWGILNASTARSDGTISSAHRVGQPHRTSMEWPIRPVSSGADVLVGCASDTPIDFNNVPRKKMSIDQTTDSLESFYRSNCTDDHAVYVYSYTTGDIVERFDSSYFSDGE